MHKLINWLTKKYEPLSNNVQGDGTALWLHIISGLLIAIAFTSLGFMCIHFAKIYDGNRPKSRLNMTYLFGLFLIFCGISRAFDVYCFWHPYLIIAGILKLLTGITSFVALLYLPYVLRLIKKAKTTSQIHEEMEDVKAKIETVHNLNKKL
jgi:uncharacterized membrane protein HdeD (DUF308 family)